MTPQRLTCTACRSDFTVDDAQDDARCSSCGTKYTVPWNDPEITRSPLLSDEEIEAANDGGTPTVEDAPSGDAREETIAVEGGATIRITIEVLPER